MVIFVLSVCISISIMIKKLVFPQSIFSKKIFLIFFIFHWLIYILFPLLSRFYNFIFYLFLPFSIYYIILYYYMRIYIYIFLYAYIYAKTETKREHWTKRWNWSTCTKLALRVSWTHGLNGIQWPWVQIPLRPTFYSYFLKSFSGEYHIYIYIKFILHWNLIICYYHIAAIT